MPVEALADFMQEAFGPEGLELFAAERCAIFGVPRGGVAGVGAQQRRVSQRLLAWPRMGLGCCCRCGRSCGSILRWILRCELPPRSQNGADQWRLSRTVGEVLRLGLNVARLQGSPTVNE
jgi:hypothetical protein